MRRMLLIDDVDTLRFALSGYFASRGFLVSTASTAEEARTAVRGPRYDVVVTDLRLGDSEDYDGLDIVATVRRTTPATRIVVLTAYGRAAVEATARRLGADLFLSKPQSLPFLADAIHALVERGGEA